MEYVLTVKQLYEVAKIVKLTALLGWAALPDVRLKAPRVWVSCLLQKTCACVSWTGQLREMTWKLRH